MAQKKTKKLLKGMSIGILANISGYMLLSLFMHYTTKIDLSIIGIPKLMGMTYVNSMHSEITAGENTGNLLKTEVDKNGISGNDIYETFLSPVERFGMSAEFELQITTLIIIFLIPVLITLSSMILMHHIHKPDDYAEVITSTFSVAIGFLLFYLITPLIFNYTQPEEPVLIRPDLSVEILQPLAVTWIAYPLIIGTVVGILYCKFSEEQKVSSKRAITGLLSVAFILLLVLSIYNAALIPGQSGFGDKSDIQLNNTVRLYYIQDDMDGSELRIAGYKQSDLEVSVDGTQINESYTNFYEISESELQSEFSIVATVSVLGKNRTYEVDTNKFKSINGPTNVTTNKTYKYEYSDILSDEVVSSGFTFRKGDSSSRVDYYDSKKYRSISDRGKIVKISSFSKNSVQVQFTESGEYAIYPDITVGKNENKPTISYWSSNPYVVTVSN